MKKQFTSGGTTITRPFKKYDHFCLEIYFKDNGSLAHAEQYRNLIEAAPGMDEAIKAAIPLIEAAHKSAVNKAVYLPLEKVLNQFRGLIAKINQQ